FYTDRVSSWTDRFVLMDTSSELHTYRLVIRGTDMRIEVDGEIKVHGQNAFWKKAAGNEPFIQFGSNSERATGEAVWQSVRLGVRKQAAPVTKTSVAITLSEPWPITRTDLKVKPTRPYVYNLGNGKLLMSIAQGQDAIHEPYGVMLSEDEGRTWNAVKDWDQTELAPLPMLPRKDGSVLGMSRWTWPQPDGTDRGHTVRWTGDLAEYISYESRLHLPSQFRPQTTPFTCERHAFENSDGSLLMAGYSKTGPSTPDAVRASKRYSHLLRSEDDGKTWRHYSVVGTGGEPSMAVTDENRMTAILRTGPFRPFVQSFSEDSGKTWSSPILLEVGSVCPDLVPMSNGLLACSYGRPAGCLMFSADEGRTWTSHHVITDKTGFNYSGIVEVRPGRLLYVHDGGGLQALTIDVKRAPSDLTSNAKSDPSNAGPEKTTRTQAATNTAPPKPTTDYALRTAKELKPTRTVIYKTLPDRKLELRLFESKGHKPTDRRPCFVAIHGGGWVAGSPDVVYCVASHFADQGWLGVSLQYRIQRAERGTTVFDCVRDGRSAIRFLRSHADELGIDPDQIVAGGRSAGGHIAAGMALFDGIDEAGEDSTISCVPNALALYSAVLDTSEQGYGKDTIGDRWAELSPLQHVLPGLPPTIILHGLRDTITPVAGAKAFAQELKKFENRYELILNERGNHSYMMRTEPLFKEAMRQTTDFLRTAGFAVPAN
ncbi:MAG: exo-alpha-sialidase, partial [Pirellulaceae bacterium]|nr:exo-alpha-sialidase [Pirellulaceae bacterium]